MGERKELDGWEIVYKKDRNPDGSLFFPEVLSEEFLLNAKKTMGMYLYSNQYENEVIPTEAQNFKKHWNRYFKEIPENHYNFAFLDPAISLQESADYTALVVISVDTAKNWYVRVANRYRITPTEIIELIFKTQAEWKCKAIGIEEVAYQKALLYMMDQEMRRRGQILPVSGVKAFVDKSKESRILGLVPRFEWGRIFLNQGLNDLEKELAQFPRGSHDDLLDALAYLETLTYYPVEKRTNEKPSIANADQYEAWYRKNLSKPRRPTQNDDW